MLYVGEEGQAEMIELSEEQMTRVYRRVAICAKSAEWYDSRGVRWCFYAMASDNRLPQSRKILVAASRELSPHVEDRELGRGVER